MANALSRISNSMEKVKELLEQGEQYRDDDEALLARYWHDELIKNGSLIEKMSCRDLLNKIRFGALTAPDIINRARRKVQEVYPETRGSKYEIRHKEKRNVRKGIVS